MIIFKTLRLFTRGLSLKPGLFAFGIMLSVITTSVSGPVQAMSAVEDCILELFQSAPEAMTIGEARVQCSGQQPADPAAGIKSNGETVKDVGAVEKRLSADDANILKPFTLMSHKANYILLAAHNFQGWNPKEFEEASGRDSLELDDTEVQFQLSIKTPLAISLFEDRLDIFASYTIRSFWQVYNSDISSPFRETNHEPEFWLQTRPDWEFLGFKNTVNILGVSHQSNGQSGNLSRSWNRVYGGFGFERGNFAFLIKPWLRIQEDAENDDNPDITDYLGHGEINMAYKYKDHTFSLMSRNNIESGFSRGAIGLGWSFPLFHYNYLKGYVQYFSGYGESLIDYDQYVNKIGIGLLLTDVL